MGGLPAGTVNGFAVDPTNPKVMYVAMRGGVFRSDTEGRTWKLAAGAPKNAAAVAVNPKNPKEVYAATMDGKLSRSTDGGGQWSKTR